MKSKIKQLLVGVLTVAVISSNFAAALIPGAATITGTIAVTENKTVVASTTDTTVDVPVKVTFTEPVTGPHGRFSITADGATLTGIEVDSFDNANAEENPDAYVRIGDEYGDDGTNLETGTILVESAIDNKAAVVKYINLVATFTVPANTAAGTVIPVTVKGIDTTNANEDNWEDLDATNGTITVEVDEPEDTLTVTTDAKPAGNTTFMARQRYTYTFTGEVASYGVLVWREAAYDAAYSETDGLDLTTYTANIPITAVDANGYTTNGLAVTGIALPKITEVFYTVPYVVDTNGVTYYSDETFSFSYAAYLIDRMTTGSTEVQAKVNAIMDLYYSTEGVQVYDGQTAPEYTFESKGTYTAVPEMTVEDNGDFVTSVSRAGATKTAALRIDIDYSNAPAYVSKGCLVYTPDDYVAGNATADFVLNGTRAEVAGISFFAFKTQYVFVPYVVDTDGNRYYGSTVKASYADWLVDKLNQGTTAAPKVQAMADLYELLEIGEAFFTVG